MPPWSRGDWSVGDAEVVVVAAGNHGDRFLPACAQGSSQAAKARQREEEAGSVCRLLCSTDLCDSTV